MQGSWQARTVGITNWILIIASHLYLHSFRLQTLLQGIYEKDENPGKIIIFIETKRRVESISRYIRGFGVKCGTLHGDKSQNERDFVLREFRSGKSNILVATDVAARGLGKLKYSNLNEMCLPDEAKFFVGVEHLYPSTIRPGNAVAGSFVCARLKKSKTK